MPSSCLPVLCSVLSLGFGRLSTLSSHSHTNPSKVSLTDSLSLYLSSLERLCFSVHTFDWVILRRTQLLSLYFTPVVPHRKGKGNALRLLATSDTLPQHADIWVCLTHWRRDRQTETDLINYIRTRWARRWRKRKPKGRKDKKRPTDRREGEKGRRRIDTQCSLIGLNSTATIWQGQRRSGGREQIICCLSQFRVSFLLASFLPLRLGGPASPAPDHHCLAAAQSRSQTA